jgi:CubicO group peptidase (beta-lactamase class C family)
MKKTIFFFALLIGSACAFAQSLEQKVKDLDAYIEKARNDWKVPGMAVVVAKDGKVLLKKGYGVRELGKPEKIDTQTLFACASTTKAMTAVCMGMLVDEGKVKWDDLVVNYLPEFQLYDACVTRELRIRDLFTHNSGVGNADFVWTIMDITPSEILEKMQLVKPSYSLRSSFIYQNIFYIAAGEVIRKVSGKSWEAFIQERIFNPLKMTRTAPMRKYIKDDNQVRPHFEVDKKIKPIGYTKDDAVGPAGSVWASIDDMSKWMLCMMDSSKYEGGRLLQPKTWVEMFKPQTLVPASEFYPTMQLIKPNWTSYGLGWFQHDYKGKKINYHTGSLSGLVAIHAQLPDEKVSIYVFENLDHAEVRHALVYKAFDLFALGGTRDWSTEFLKLYGGIREKAEKVEKDFEAKRVMNTTPSLPLTEYTGKYTDPLYGELEISLEGNKLVIDINHFEKATVEHWNYNTFRGMYQHDWDGHALAHFSLNTTGQVEKISLDGLEFTKVKK